jgi:hypothetical protein
MFYRCQRFNTNQYKEQVRDQNERNRRLPWSGAPDCPVCHRTMSDAPGWINSNSPPSGFWKCHSAIIHRTVQCASGATATAQRSTPTETCKSATVREQCMQSQSRRQKAHRTVNSDCLVHHRTVGGPGCRSSNDRTLMVG